MQLQSLLENWHEEESRRAKGGLHAIAGFDFQSRVAIADLFESLTSGKTPPHDAKQLFTEALSDILKIEDDHLVCIQVKRTLTKQSLKTATAEVEAVHKFLSAQDPSHAQTIRFEVVAHQGTVSAWDDIREHLDASPILSRLHKEGRLLAPRFEADPWWRAVSSVWHQVDGPLELARFALDRILSQTPDPSHLEVLFQEIIEEFDRRRKVPPKMGRIYAPEDFELRPEGPTDLAIGQLVTPERLQKGQYWRRDRLISGFSSFVLERTRERAQQGPSSEVEVVWLEGRSGSGKSVALVQLLETLVREGHRVVWLGSHADQLFDLLEHLVSEPADGTPDFILIDDLYAPEARDELDLLKLSRFLASQEAHWPLIVTCGPPEFATSFLDDARHRGFALEPFAMPTANARDAKEFARWHQQRSGQQANLGPAFHQADEGDGLFISMAVELEHGDLKQFAARFVDRLAAANLVDALSVPLALGSLYIWTPETWFDEPGYRERLETLEFSGDFSLTTSSAGHRYVRLTHPHLAAAFYSAIRTGSSSIARAHDLAAAFERAMAQQDRQLVRRLLRTFAARTTDPLMGERLANVDMERLLLKCAHSWKMHSGHQLPWRTPDELADAAVSWACLELDYQDLAQSAGMASPVDFALETLDKASFAWPMLWQRLAGLYPDRRRVRSWALGAVGETERQEHPQWSRVWEACEPSGDKTSWMEAAQHWLRGASLRPDWHFVWKWFWQQSTTRTWAREIAQERTRSFQEGPEWAYLIQDLLADAETRGDQHAIGELLSQAFGWIQGREERADWTHIWRALLERHLAIPKHLNVSEATLLDIAWKWIQGREDRAEWAHVWEALLERQPAIPKNLNVSEATLLDIAWKWIQGRENRAEWAHVWKALLERHLAIPKQLNVSEAALLDIAWQWIQGREDRAEWAHVWKALLERQPAIPKHLNVSEATLLDIAWQWIQGREERAEWTHIWRALLESQPAILKHLNVSEATLLGIAWKWIQGREERAEWTHVWEALLERQTAIPKHLNVSEATLLGIAWQWMQGREKRAEWTHVWEELLERQPAIPKHLNVSEATLLDIAWQWIQGREERAEWTHMWRALLERQTAIPKRLNVSEATLLDIAWKWIQGREERAEWTHIWRALLERQTAIPKHLNVSEATLLGIAWKWIQGREERAEWTHVWEALLERQTAIPKHLNVSEATLLEIAWKWIQGREERAEWTHIWEELVERQEAIPAHLGVSEAILFKVAWQWMDGREDRADWAFVVTQLLKRHRGLSKDPNLDSVANRGWQWIQKHNDEPSAPVIWYRIAGLSETLTLASQGTFLDWGRLWFLNPSNLQSGSFTWIADRLMEMRCNDEDIKAVIDPWLLTSKHPSRDIIAIKRIALAPQDDNAQRLARRMLARIQEGERIHWKSRQIMTTLPKHQLTDDVKSLAEALAAAGTPTMGPEPEVGKIYKASVSGHQPYGLFARIDGHSGLLHTSNAQGVELSKENFPYDSHIQVRILGHNSKGYIFRLESGNPKSSEGAEQNDPPEVGKIYPARIKSHQIYGIFASINGFDGLLHISNANGTDLAETNFPIGSEIRVQVLGQTPKGLELGIPAEDRPLP